MRNEMAQDRYANKKNKERQLKTAIFLRFGYSVDLKLIL